MTTTLSDMTLADLRLALAPAVAQAAVFDGWSATAIRTAAQDAGVDPHVARLAFDGGAMTMIAAWIASIDRDMTVALPETTLATFPIRERIRRLVQFRLDAASPDIEALRRALAIMAMPQNVPAALKLSWQSADAMWRLAGDRATDYNHYTKRTILAGIYAATLTVLAEDTSEDHADTRAFLERRIDGVMKFEKAKARLLRPRDDSFSVMRLLGRLRYPAR